MGKIVFSLGKHKDFVLNSKSLPNELAEIYNEKKEVNQQIFNEAIKLLCANGITSGFRTVISSISTDIKNGRIDKETREWAIGVLDNAGENIAAVRAEVQNAIQKADNEYVQGRHGGGVAISPMVKAARFIAQRLQVTAIGNKSFMAKYRNSQMPENYHALCGQVKGAPKLEGFNWKENGTELRELALAGYEKIMQKEKEQIDGIEL